MPEFVIVGTARSGTTLVQRLACELTGVHVPPETHLLSDLLPHLAREGQPFPLSGPALRDALQWYSHRPYLRDVPFDPPAVAAALGDHCASGAALFAAVVDQLSGDVPIRGEKTPGHLLWWKPLTHAFPDLRVVVVVRDPRGVHASFHKEGWGGAAALNAQRWKADARTALDAISALGGRAILLRYEDVVADPDGAREQLRRHLGAPPGQGAPDGQMFPVWESWKAAATGPIAVDGTERWRSAVSRREQGTIEAICRREMLRLGYTPETPAVGLLTAPLRLSPRIQLSRLKRRVLRWRTEQTVRRIGRAWRDPAAA